MENDKIEAEIDFNDKYLRVYAEFENYKKRVNKEKSDLVIDTKFKTISSILDLNDDLNYAKMSLGDNEGLNLLIDKFNNFLNSLNIEEIQTNNYDSDIHEVISVFEHGKVIIEVISKGYMIDGKIVRYPKVILGNA